jgi:hypothetical protein
MNLKISIIDNSSSKVIDQFSTRGTLKDFINPLLMSWREADFYDENSFSESYYVNTYHKSIVCRGLYNFLTIKLEENIT